MIQIPFSHLSTKELYTLGLRTKELCLSIDLETTGLNLFYTHFSEQFEKYEQAMNKIHVKAEEVALADNKRDDLFIGIKSNVRSYMYHPDDEKRNAAATLYRILNEDGEAYRLSYKEETAILERIFSQLDSNYIPLIVLLGLNDWYAELKESQADFETKLHNYTSQKADHDALSSATTLRPALVQAMRKLFAFIPMQAEISGDESLKQLAEQLAVEAARF